LQFSLVCPHFNFASPYLTLPLFRFHGELILYFFINHPFILTSTYYTRYVLGFIYGCMGKFNK
jgi:hypothetical protein